MAMVRSWLCVWPLYEITMAVSESAQASWQQFAAAADDDGDLAITKKMLALVTVVAAYFEPYLGPMQ